MIRFSKGDRVKDRFTGSTGTVQGQSYAPSPVPGGGGWTHWLILWDGTTNPVPWTYQNKALELI